MSLSEDLGLTVPTEELEGVKLQERLAFLVTQSERLIAAGVTLSLGRWREWPRTEQEVWLVAGDRVRRTTAALNGTAASKGAEEVLAPIDGGAALLQRKLEERADAVEARVRAAADAEDRAAKIRQVGACRPRPAPTYPLVGRLGAGGV